MNYQQHLLREMEKPSAFIVRNAKVAAARVRFGRPFAHELGSTWKPPRIPVLTVWAGRRT